MKKGVLLAGFLLFLLFLFAFQIPAQETRSELGEETSSVSPGEHGEEIMDDPLPEGEAAGYWIAYTEGLDEEGKEVTKSYYFFQNQEGESSVGLLGDVPTDEDALENRLNDDEEGWSVSYDTIYSDFNIQTEGETDYPREEIIGLKFALDMWLSYLPNQENPGLSTSSFETDDLESWEIPFDSHGYFGGSKEEYEGTTPPDSQLVSMIPSDQCVVCDKADDLESCRHEGETGLPSQGRCIYIGILNRDNCSVIADMNQQFCEGVEGLGLNSGKGRIRVPNSAGFGGCRNESVLYGRDWYRDSVAGVQGLESTLEEGFSKANAFDTSEIGDCCGNEEEDIGALRPAYQEYYSNTLDAVMCMPVPLHPAGTDIPFTEKYLPQSSGDDDFAFVWNSAEGDSFRVRRINRSGILFDAVGNNENWFVCNARYKDVSLDEVYEPKSNEFGLNDPKTPGPLLSEFESLPKPQVTINYGTTAVGVEEGDAGDGEGPLGTEQPGNLGAGAESEREVIDQDSFDDDLSDARGPLFSTPCDMDGDGYDGAYSQDSLFQGISLHDEQVIPDSPERYNEECENPQPPFDCDETNPSNYPGSPLYCSDVVPGRDMNCNDIIDTEELCMGEELMPCSPEASEPGECEFSPRDLSERFMCFYEQSNVDTVKGSFAECCGFSLSFCNNPSDIGRREGSHIKTLREFVTYAPATTDANVCSKNDSNCVLRYALNKPTPQDVEDNIPYSLGFSSAFNDVDIKDWTSYEYLEFYIYFAANFEQNIKIGRLVGNPEIIEGYSYYFDGPVTDYVVNEPELGKWLHVVIPIDEFIGKPEEVDLILFYADAEELHKAGTTINVGAFPQKDFSNVIGLDKIHLVKEDGENRFCSGTLKPHWLEDLDDSSYVDTPELGYNQAGRAACNAIPSYGWTGNYCCGDDTGRDTEFDPANPGGRKIGDDTFKEFFNDTEAGCWAGQKVADGERMMLVQYILSHEHALGYTDKLFEKSCRSTDGCVYSIPQVPGLVIENPHHETYDLLIGSGTGITRKHVGPGTVLSSNSAQGAVLKSEDVPLQVLFHDKQFRACNGAPYLFEKSNTEVTTDMLILPENNYSSCEIAGDYFCDHVNGSDRGWSAASLTKYPNSTNITLSDGSTVEILTEGSEAPTDRIPPSYRDQIKPTYNLIKNGGFERLR